MAPHALLQHVRLSHDGSLPRTEPSNRYLALAAEVAERLLGAADPARMVDELFELVRTELRLDVFFNYRFSEGQLVLEAHGGLTPAEAEAGRVLEVGQAVCGCVARDRRRVHAVAVRSSGDPLVAFVKAIGLDAYACTPLVHGTDLLGTLGFGRRWADRFTEDELSFVHTICHYVALAKYRLRVEAELRSGVAERERLLSELNHRVRNSLQMAVGLVAIDAAGAEDERVRAALERAASRLEVLAIAHRPLYATASVSGLDVLEVLRSSAERELLFDASTTARAYLLPVEQAVALALLVRSLASQPDKPPPSVGIAIDPGNRRLVLTFQGPDWGRNDMAASEMRIAQMLLRQLKGELSYIPSTTLSVSMPYAARN